MSDTVLLTPTHAEAIVRAIEAAPQVRRRYQFFVWTQYQLQALLPHNILVCAAYQRARRELAYEAFNSVPVPQPALDLLTDGGSAFMRHLTSVWIESRGLPLAVDVAVLPGDPHDGRQLLLANGLSHLLLHGVSRPQRPAEIETLFVFATSGGGAATVQHRTHLDLLLPHLHNTYLRVQSMEREINGQPARAAAPRAGATATVAITDRERQILAGVREGKSNQQIGEALGISALTVKNHVQKILRKLGAANRAQAVAKAMTMNLLARGGDGATP